MKLLSILFVLFCVGVSAQNTKFEISKESGLTEFIIQVVPGKSASELYNKSVEWINKTYKNPQEVILAKVENDYLRFEGFNSSLFCYHALGMKNCNDVKYQIEISFKDDKYKMQVVSISEFIKPSKSNVPLAIAPGWRTNAQLQTIGSNCYKKNGDVKGMCKDYVVVVPDFFNSISNDLYQFITLGKNNDW